MKPTKFSRAFSMLEILGGCAILLTVAGLAVYSVKDSVVAGQRASIQRELQGLNSSLNAFLNAGGSMDGVTTAESAITRLQAGVGEGVSSFRPLVVAPESVKKIGGKSYVLGYGGEGFFYADADTANQAFVDVGKQLSADDHNSQFAMPAVDLTQPSGVDAALAEMGGFNPESPEYADYLEELNNSLASGQISADDLNPELLDAAGLVLYNGALMSKDNYRVMLANEAADMLGNGYTWDMLSHAHQMALAELYPDSGGGGGGGGAAVFDEGRPTRGGGTVTPDPSPTPN